MKTISNNGKLKGFGMTFMTTLLMAFLVLVMTGASPAAADENIVAETTLDSIQDILSLDSTVPADMMSLPNSVYDNNMDTPFLLSEQNELMMFLQKNGTSKIYVYDGVDLSKYESTGLDKMNENVLDYNINKASAQSTTENLTPGDILSNMTFTEGVSFDLTGSGRRDHVGIIGLHSNGNVYVIVKNTTNNTTYSLNLGAATWMRNATFWTGTNYVDITAGDYDHDGKDTLVVYVTGDSSYKIFEVKLVGSTLKAYDLLDLSSITNRTDFNGSKAQAYKKPIVSLTTGDLDGDGVEEFAYMVGFHNAVPAKEGTNYDADTIEPYCAHVGVLDLGKKGWSHAGPLSMYADEGMAKNGGFNYRLMYGGGITASDTDGDGTDELVAVGYTSRQAEVYFNRGKVCGIKDPFLLDTGNYAYSVIVYDGKSCQKRSFDTLEMSPFFSSKFDIGDKVYSEIAIASAKVNGDNSPEFVFVAGDVYSFEGNTPTRVFRGDMARDLGSMLGGLNGTGRKNSSLNWVQNVTVGNFDGNNYGREQFAFVAYEKHSGENKYSANLGVIAGVAYGDIYVQGELKSVGTTRTMASSLYMEEAYKKRYYITDPVKISKDDDNRRATQVFVDDSASTTNSKYMLNALPIAIDCDSDGLLARSGKRGYAYSDPVVHAVLEAAPYYKEIESAYEDTGETYYTIETSSGYASSTGHNVSLGVGFTGEAEAPGLKASLELGYTMDWSSSIEKAVETTFSSTFATGQDDVVILSRTPEVVYCYDIYKDGRWIPGGYTVRTALAPTFFILTVSDYNEFVDAYNGSFTDKPNLSPLVKITENDLPAGHNGNPFAYWSSWSEAGQGGKQISNSSYAVKVSAGSTSSEWSMDQSITESTETSHGFHFGYTVQVGASFSLGVEVEAWAGGYGELDYSHSAGYSKTSTSSNGAGGSVCNPNKSIMMSNPKLSEMLGAYHFNWTFGQWTRTLQSDNIVPFYGYVTSKVSAPAHTVMDLDAQFTTSQDDEDKMVILLSWSDPGDRYLPTKSYTIYLYDEKGKQTTVATDLPADTTEYVFDGVDGRSSYTFTMTTMCTKLGQPSIESEPATLTMESKAIYDIRLTDEGEKQDDYTIFYTDGSTSKFVVKHGKDGKDGKDGEKGEKGDTGATGPQGPQGAPGIQGPQGDPGPAGSSSGTGNGSGSGVSVTPFMSPSEPTNQIGVVIGFDGGYKMYITSDGIGFQMPDGSFLYDYQRQFSQMFAQQPASLPDA